MEKITGRIEKLEAFFDVYAQKFNESLQGNTDVDSMVNSFAESFIEASPKGIMSGKNDAEFKKGVVKGYEYYKNIGTKSMDIMDKGITLLDEFHAMVKIGWKGSYEKKDGKTLMIEFDVFYMVQELNGSIKIFAYVTGDEQKALKDNDLI